MALKRSDLYRWLQSVLLDANGRIIVAKGLAFPSGTQDAPASGGGSYPATGALSVTSASGPSTLNLTTDGTRGWFILHGTLVTPRQQNPPYRKILGEMDGSDFDWIVASSGSNTGFTQGSGLAVTATDNLVAGLTSYATDEGYYDGSGTGFGFQFSAPADTYSRTLKVYASSYSGDIQLTASLSDGSATTVTKTGSSASSTETRFVFTLTYNAARDGQRLRVKVLKSANFSGTNGNIKFQAATLS